LGFRPCGLRLVAAFFFGVGELAALLLPWATPAEVVLEPSYLNHWTHWDGELYLKIATEGYDATEVYDLGAPISTAFFPCTPCSYGRAYP
jgi:hypothetical protein